MKIEEYKTYCFQDVEIKLRFNEEKEIDDFGLWIHFVHSSESFSNELTLLIIMLAQKSDYVEFYGVIEEFKESDEATEEYTAHVCSQIPYLYEFINHLTKLNKIPKL